jgi:hypothetical protein
MPGGLIGLKRRGKIIKYNNDGTVLVQLIDGLSFNDDENTHSVPLPMAFCSPNGAFIGGYPSKDTPVLIERGQGSWFISGFDKPDNIFTENKFGYSSIDNNLMGEFTQDRILLQTKNASNRIYLDPEDGISAGTSSNSLKIDSKRNILSNNLGNQYDFSYGHRLISGTIKRDIEENSVRNVSCSTLTDNDYNDSLWTVGMDPFTNISSATTKASPRNLPLTEIREVIYETAELNSSSLFESDLLESKKYDPTNNTQSSSIEKSQCRATAFGLNLYNPNHLIEIIAGTGVDNFGNILDLNRNILPLGKDISFSSDSDNIESFKKIRAEHRKSLVYHFEINSRKAAIDNDIYEPKPVTDKTDYARDRSRFFIDIDKEGQFKINIPASSETGNIPLLTRYENLSTIAYGQGDIDDPNKLVFDDNRENSQDIYLECFANTSPIKLKNNEKEISPIDRFLDESQPLIRFGTAHHDISKVGYQFTKKRIEDDVGGKLIRYMSKCQLNERQDEIQVDKLLSTEINVSGDNANAGGRSGSINMDGFLTMNIGANTIDRQSLWLDTAGGIVSAIGRDKNGVSLLSSMDGDVYIQIGGAGIGTAHDSRFKDQNDGARSGAFDLRVLKSDGQLSIIRIDNNGVSITSSGRMEFCSQQTMIFRSNTEIMFEAPNIIAYPDSSPRVLKRSANTEWG